MITVLQNSTPVTARTLAKASSPAEAGPTESFQPSGTEENPSKLREAFNGILNSGGVAKAQLLQDGAAAWNKRWKLTESATSTIHTQYFCWDRDCFGMALMGHMYKKAKNDHVQIKLMVDATGDTWGTRGFKSHIGGKDYVQELVGTGNVQAKVYHPHWKKVVDQVLSVGSTAISASNHDKILEVDGDRGITGGRNIGYEYFVHPDDFRGAWRDQDVYFEGKETARALRSAFDVEFGAPWITSPIKKDSLGNWVKRDIELIGAYKMMDLWLKDKPLDASEKDTLRKSPEARAEAAENLMNQALACLPEEGIDRAAGNREKKSLMKLAKELVSYTEMRGSYHAEAPAVHDAEVKIVDKTSSVGIGLDEINPNLAKLAQAAQKSIVIENPYVCLSQDSIDTFKEAGKRGVQIMLGTNSPASTDSDVTQAFFLRDWPRLEATIPNLKIFCATGDRKLHAKTAVVDEQASLVTTYNLDFISHAVNSEVGAVIWSEDFAKEATAGFMRDHADPRNGVVEYTILRDDKGTPIRKDGLPVLDDKGELINDPEVTFGPANHLPPETLKKYATKVHRWNFIRKFLPQLESVNTFKKVPDK